ncbi:sensor histidine kinase [Nonomuraea sp. NPDC050556]|uniref:sensor histidine kinase n=1 Tax=Nonomuraea sp. NPDC050556 TaxID=3364369 RepID=UPI0037A8303B
MFGKVRAWSRRHSRLVDVLWASPLVLLCLFTLVTFSGYWPGGANLAAYALLTTALLVPLYWRNTHPRLAFAAIALVSFAQWLGKVDPIPANVALMLGLFAVTSHCTRRWAIAAGLVVEFGVFLALVNYDDVSLSMFIFMSTVPVTVWLAGIYASTRRRYLEGLEERAERAERERDQQARIAAAAERTRIARELHDVVAHNVSVIVVQADGAGYAIDSDPEAARRAVQAISKTGREALKEMRRLVGVLRQDDPSATDYLPQPGLRQLTELVRGSGLPVELKITGTPVDLPEGEQLTIYRIVQEALTNALKHGGPRVRATVELDYTDQELLVRITDDGRGAAALPGLGGHGLIGMRERVGMYGGAVQAGPNPGGGFQVQARLPVAA